MYCLCYYSCPSFSPFAPLHLDPLIPLGNPHTIVHAPGSCIRTFWLLYFLYCTLHPYNYSAATDLYFLIPSPFLPMPQIPLLSGNHQNVHCIYDCVSVLFVHLFCFFVFRFNSFFLNLYCYSVTVVCLFRFNS